LKKRFRLLTGRQSTQSAYFTLGKETSSNFVACKLGIDELNINAQSKSPSYSKERKILGMRQVELDTGGIEARAKFRFAFFSIRKCQIFWRNSLVFRKDFPQRGMGDGKAISVPLEIEAVGTLELILGKQPAAALDRVLFHG
jgi:hypothetical protein